MRARRSLLLENLVLRQQLALLKRRHPSPRIRLLDKLFWVGVRRIWSGWKQSLIVVTPETVVRWHQSGFSLYWRLISRAKARVGRRQTSKEVQELIFRMVVENPTWGAPRIHGELLMLGFAHQGDNSTRVTHFSISLIGIFALHHDRKSSGIRAPLRATKPEPTAPSKVWRSHLDPRWKQAYDIAKQ